MTINMHPCIFGQRLWSLLFYHEKYYADNLCSEATLIKLQHSQKHIVKTQLEVIQLQQICLVRIREHQMKSYGGMLKINEMRHSSLKEQLNHLLSYHIMGAKMVSQKYLVE